MTTAAYPHQAEDVPYTKGLHRLTEHVWSYLLPDGSWGWSNAGVVTGDGESLLFDTLFDLALTQDMLAAVSEAVPNQPIRNAVLSHANGDHCFGTELLANDIDIYASPETAHGMLEVSPEEIVELFHADLGPVGTAFFHDCFSPFRFDNITMRLPNQSVPSQMTLDVGGTAVELIPLGPAHTEGDLIAWIPDDRVLFTGDLLFNGGTPVMWAGPAENWINACDTMLALQPEFVVPGHGPVTNHDALTRTREYWSYLSAQARELHDRGLTSREAAFAVDLGEYRAWGDAERTVVNMHSLYREIDPDTPPVDILRSFADMAEWRVARP